MEGDRAMVAVCLCAAFSGLTGFGLSLALVEGGAWGAGLKFLALGLVGLVGVVSRPLRTV
jgi:hypothetical protein